MESLSDRLNRVQPTFGRLPWGAEPRSYPQPYWVPQSASGGQPGHVVGGEVQSGRIQPILQGLLLECTASLPRLCRTAACGPVREGGPQALGLGDSRETYMERNTGGSPRRKHPADSNPTP